MEEGEMTREEEWRRRAKVRKTASAMAVSFSWRGVKEEKGEEGETEEEEEEEEEGPNEWNSSRSSDSRGPRASSPPYRSPMDWYEDIGCRGQGNR